MTDYPFIPVCRPFLTGREKEYVQDALETGWISSAGTYLNRFEKSFAALVNCSQGVACTNGTAAVHLALLACGVTVGDRVALPSFTMMASVFPIMQLGAEPVFVDCSPDTWTLDPAALAKVEGPIKAVMPVHIYGHPCDMDPIREWANAMGAFVIEDAAESHGSTYKGEPTGSLGDVAAFSFYANKVLTTGEGGMLTTNNAELADKARYYRNLCFNSDPAKRFIHEDIGYNYRLTNIQAAIGLAQVEEAEMLMAMRRSMAAKYLERLAPLTEFIQLPVEMDWAKNSYWMFGILIGDGGGINAETAIRKFREYGVDTRRFFYPGHRQPALKQFGARVEAPVSDMLWEKGIYLPSSSDLTDAEADQVAEALKQILNH